MFAGSRLLKSRVGISTVAAGLLSLGAAIVPAAAVGTITTSCTDGTSHTMAAPAYGGQTTADGQFNAHVGQVLGIICTTS